MVIDFSSLYDGPSELERFFEDMLHKNSFSSRIVPYPLVNIAENEEEYIVDICLPGVPPDEIDLVITARNLIIKGERKSPEGRYYRQERKAGSFQRVLSLNVAVDRDNVTARDENGILRVILPKSAAARPRKISIAS